MTPGIGHNSNHDPNGYAGRLHQWRRARRALVSRALPVEVIRSRMRRADALGLDFRTYASVRASTGRDVVALLFSSSALGMLRRAELDARAARKLAGVSADCAVLVHAPVPVAAPAPLGWAERAPSFLVPPGAAARAVAAALRARKLPADAVLIVGATAAERAWCAGARAAGYVDAEGYFAS
ncbi:hypothetical protein [Jannaschia sp. W003]|uniref:hypothetical protein n=1 Tax=Jannaschia sp. W003 TaxID=2867012 RepID=UPI0021A45BA7|nr:hypothetical protein [Jannaschia sp. W003]UWQ20064.1 hypothetical protein K3554_08565 [Jannaschia sp. W003]